MRILHIIDTLGRGGAETLLVNTGKDASAMLYDNINYRKHLMELENFPPNLKPVLRKNLSEIYFYNGWILLRNTKNYKEGIKAMKSGVVMNKSLLLNPRIYLAYFLALFNK